jgi:hypothetical protein
LYVAGSFDRAGNAGATRLARWNGDSWWAADQGEGFNPLGIGPPVYAMTTIDDGAGPALILGGDFGGLGDTAAENVARFQFRGPRGDLDHDRQIGIGDFALLLSHFGTPSGMTDWQGDLDDDADVDLGDLALLLAALGDDCP